MMLAKGVPIPILSCACSLREKLSRLGRSVMEWMVVLDEDLIGADAQQSLAPCRVDKFLAPGSWQVHDVDRSLRESSKKPLI